MTLVVVSADDLWYVVIIILKQNFAVCMQSITTTAILSIEVNIMLLGNYHCISSKLKYCVRLVVYTAS